MTFLRELGPRLSALWRVRTVAAFALLIAVGGVALTRVPLFGVPGFELSAALTIALTFVGGLFGAAAARLERARATSGEPRTGDAAFLRAWGPASALSLLTLVPPFFAAVLGALLGSRCNPWTGAGFYLVLPVPTALLAPAAGALVGFATKRRWTAVLLYLALSLGSVAVSLAPIWFGPQVFALNHFAGYLPGPLYDEAVGVDRRILTYRLLTLMWLGLALALGGLLVDPQRGVLRRARPSRRRLVALSLLLAGIATFRIFEFPLGLGTSAADLDRVLGGHAETAHFVLHFPRTKPKEDVARLERDLEYDYDQVTRFFGSTLDGKIDAYFHKSAEDKQWLVGASHTNFAKPWRREFQVQDEAFPHPIARHEMAHVIAGAFGSPLLKVSARGLVLVNAGIVEGLATAADNRADELTLDEWAAAMRRLKLAPDLKRIVGPAGFYTESQWRAYTLAGSFLRFLTAQYGTAKLQALYPTGDFAAAYGKPLDALVKEWEAMLDALPLDERALHAAQLRFEKPGIFGRPCAHELALLRDEASKMSRADPDLALRLYQRCTEIEPNDVGLVRDWAALLHHQKDYAGATALWTKLIARTDLSPGQRAQALMELGDLSWEAGHIDEAKAHFNEVLALHRDRATDRTAAVKLEALADPEAAPVLQRFFAKSADLPEVLRLKDLAIAQPKNATARYLIGRQLYTRGDFEGAVQYLTESNRLGLASDEVRHENDRLLAQALYQQGDCAAMRDVLDRLTKGGSAADAAFREEWDARCRFEEAKFGNVLKAER